jgi:EAL domain-containing protein (putative c-di-GMP-specific phosphodiesterase class I)
VVRTCHDGTTAKGLDSLEDALVVSSHISLGQYGSSLFINALDNGLAAQHGQWFARKACRRVSGGYNSDKLHNFIYFACKDSANREKSQILFELFRDAAYFRYFIAKLVNIF